MNVGQADETNALRPHNYYYLTIVIEHRRHDE